MAALQNDNTINQCDRLNKLVFPTLWFNANLSDISGIPNIVIEGRLKRFSEVVATLTTAQLQGKVLTSGTGSAYSLIKFLEGSGVANLGSDYSKLSNILLSGVTAGSVAGYRSIVDNYFVSGSITNDTYTYSTATARLITPTMIWNPSDTPIINAGSATPTSILGKIIHDGFLLSERELYNPQDFNPSRSLPPANTESLLYLQSLSHSSGTSGGTADQQNRRATLEARNLRFFGAWLVEYCYYRSRYEWLLSKYFTVYTTTPYVAPNLTTNLNIKALFKRQQASSPAPNEYTSTTLAQSEYLRCLVYHMACLNTRMVDMRLLLGKISEYYSSVQTVIQNAVNNDSILGSNTDMTNKITALNESASSIADYITEKDLREGVMQYNLEKNRYANILLGFYAFLNIVAVAMIIQIRNT